MITLVALGLLLNSASALTNPAASYEQAVEFQRKILFLLSETSGNAVSRERDVFISRNYYHLKRELLEAIESSILEESKHSRPKLAALISYIQNGSLRAADTLTFIDLVDNLLFQHSEEPYLSSQALGRLRQIEQSILLAQKTYKDDLEDVYNALGTRGVKLEPWQDYIGFLRARYNKKDIYQEFNMTKPELAEPAMRGASKNTEEKSLVWGFNVPDKTVVLTFDDGPHYRNTGAVLDILKTHDAKGYFFAVGKNIGTIKDDAVTLNKKSSLLKRAIKEGHLLGNHSFSHKVLTKLDVSEQANELSNANRMLTAVSGQDVKYFRPPYGSKNTALIDLSTKNGMQSIMWNIDSMDWGDPIPESIVERTMAELKKKKRGILLFHDIHKQTVQALPILLKRLKDEGYRIVTINGNAFENEAKTKTSIEAAQVTANKSKLYSNSWALIIGVNKYTYWPQLSYAVNDAKGVSALLSRQYGFSPDRIFTLLDEEATRENITQHLADVLADPERIKENDRVFIFYAGHGMTRTLPSGRNLGYIIPVDAELDKFHSKSISMTHLQDFSEMIPAKHVYFVMDSCYSGIALTRSGGTAKSSKYLSEISSRHARQILTAGGADQEVADGGPGGHSVFTWSLMQGLSGEADLDKNNIITASELGAYVSPAVSENSNQTPAFGNLVGSQGGEFLFELAVIDDGLNELSSEDQLKQKILELKKENISLKQRLSSLQENISQAPKETRSKRGNIEGLSHTQRKIKANKLHSQGLKFYKEKNYSRALEMLNSALQYNPTNSGIVNDYGFVLYKDGQLNNALLWLEKTIELSPNRIPVYLNIADTLAELGRRDDAVSYYKYYLELYPDSPVKDRVDKFLRL